MAYSNYLQIQALTTHSGVTTNVHGFDASGKAPPQAHSSTSHSGTIGTESQVAFDTSSGHAHGTITVVGKSTAGNATDSHAYTVIYFKASLTNGNYITSVGCYTIANGVSIKFKICLYNGSNSFTPTDLQTFTTTSVGTQSWVLTTPYLIPASGTYYLGYYVSNINPTNIESSSTGTNRYFVAGDITTATAFTSTDTYEPCIFCECSPGNRISWSNISSKPTAISSFTNDSGFQTGYCTYCGYCGYCSYCTYNNYCVCDCLYTPGDCACPC